MASEPTVKRKSKDNVFVKLFEDKKYVLQMCKELHPEISDVTVDDIDIQTLETVIVNNIYNDLGFVVKDTVFALKKVILSNL